MVTVRRMQENDVNPVYDLSANIKGLAVSEWPRFLEKKEVYSCLNNSSNVLLVAEDDGKISGYLMSRIHISTRNAIIENVHVDEQYRRRGVGSSLVGECLKKLKEKGIVKLFGYVKKDDEATIKFLRSLGFKRYYDFPWMKLSLFFQKLS
jgi:ribosomal protein S18 acetylase RimI-like enzyme